MPSPPDFDGYDEPTRFEYPTVRIHVGSAILLVVALVGYVWLAAALRSDGLASAFDGWAGLAIVLALPVTFVVHEAVHGLALWLLGYRVTYGIWWSKLLGYAAALRQRTSRRDTAIVAGAPLALVTPIGVGALAVADGAVFVFALVALVVNTAGAITDLYALYRLAGLPGGSILYSESVDTSWIYEPAGSEGSAVRDGDPDGAREAP